MCSRAQTASTGELLDFARLKARANTCGFADVGSTAHITQKPLVNELGTQVPSHT